MIRIELMTYSEVLRVKSFNEITLEQYQKHNMHGCYDDLIKECEGKIQQCEKIIKLLKSEGCANE